MCRKVIVAREHQQVVANAQLSEERVNRAGLHALAPTDVAQFCGANVILSLRHDQRQCRESLEYLFAGLGSRKPLKEFLQHEPSGQDGFPAVNHPN